MFSYRGLQILLAVLLALGGAASASACTCGFGGPFPTVAQQAEPIIVGRVLSYVSYGMDVEVIDVLRGEESRNVVRVWGDPGHFCRPAVGRFALDTEWVFALSASATWYEGEAPDHYALQSCGEYWLRVTDGTVYIQDRLERIRLSRLTSEIRGWDAPTFSPESCRRLEAQGFVNVSALRAEYIAAGRFEPPDYADASAAPAYHRLTAICRINGVFEPGLPDESGFELWVPAGGWTGGRKGFARSTRTDPLSDVSDAASIAAGEALFVLRTSRSTADTSRSSVGRFATDFVDRLHRHVEGEARYPDNAPPLTHAMRDAATLPAADGRVTGQVLYRSAPVEGLPLRLALNNMYWTHWTTTGGDGRFTVDLPAGGYTLTGYQIDLLAADEKLAGVVAHPGKPVTGALVVTDGGNTDLPHDFLFVEPVVIRAPLGEVSATAAQRIEWAPYPGAVSYRINIEEEQEGALARMSLAPNPFVRRVRAATETRRTAVDLAELELEPSFRARYSVSIIAFDEDGKPLSTSVRDAEPTFRVTSMQ